MGGVVSLYPGATRAPQYSASHLEDRSLGLQGLKRKEKTVQSEIMGTVVKRVSFIREFGQRNPFHAE